MKPRLATTLFCVAVLLALPASAQRTKAVTIGTLTLGGTDQFGTLFTVKLDASAVTAQTLQFYDAALTVTTDTTTATQHSHPSLGVITLPETIAFIGGTSVATLPGCANGCKSIELQLLSLTGTPFSFVLLNGQTFSTYAVSTTFLEPLPGHLFLQTGQSTPIVLLWDPNKK